MRCSSSSLAPKAAADLQEHLHGAAVVVASHDLAAGAVGRRLAMTSVEKSKGANGMIASERGEYYGLADPPPRADTPVIRRPRLLRRLAGESNAAILMAVAPAGYGKTTLRRAVGASGLP